ncbi:MAG TPA: tryptophan 2,3-dioxygenase family protein [Candidatus Thermoplasmatota archaeon]|jgi:tryptophan 2,3-dioxygenase|nr:tryptophan 2,3-dioxygenase family protein [Candidatus Thermoplasmatota archaeon]
MRFERPAVETTDYERYLRVPELLALQKPPEERAHRDELLFQVEHQSAELWFKLILSDMANAGELMDANQPLEAERLFERAARVMALLTEQILILTTMAPWDYHTIRLKLGRGSGAESPGFRALLVEPKALWPKFEALLQRRNVGLDAVYVSFHDHYDLFRLAEGMTDFDMRFQVWRLTHLTFIKRVIGRDVTSLKGYSVHQLEEAMGQQIWPELWAVRNRLTERAGTSPSYG